MFRENEKKMSDLDYFVVMDAKWWVLSDDREQQGICYTIAYHLTSYDGNSKTRFILLTDNKTVTKEDVDKSAVSLFKYEGASKVYSFNYYQESKVDAIRSAVAELPDDAVYVVLDEENLYNAFPGRSVILDMDDFTDSIKKACRFLHYGYWWNYRHRFQSFRFEDYIEDGFTNVIFLDIDGVLNADDYKDPVRVQEHRVALLADIVKATKAEIILSSSWRRSVASWISEPTPSQDGRIDWGCELIRLLAKYRLSIAGVTEELSSGPDARPLEIRSWLAKRTEVLNFVILDDDDFWTWYWLSPHSILTSERYKDEKGWSQRKAGLEQKHVDKAIKILNWYKKPQRN